MYHVHSRASTPFRQKKTAPQVGGGSAYTLMETRLAAEFLQRLSGANIDCSQSAGILGIRLGIKSHLLTLVERLETVGNNCGKMHKNIPAAVIVGNKAEALSALNHFTVPLNIEGTS